jgi:hypothetical protein
MRRLIALTVPTILLLLVGGGAAHAAVVDFEQFDLGGNTFLDVGASLVFPNVDGSGVDLTIIEGADNRIYDLFLFADDPAASDQALIDFAWPFGSNGNGTTILFSSAVSSFSLIAGDFGSDADGPIMITAYDSEDNIVGEDSVSWSADQMPPFALLSVDASSIHKVIYLSGGDFKNSTFIDDLTFTPVPEPSTALLLGMGLVFMAHRASRRPHAQR